VFVPSFAARPRRFPLETVLDPTEPASSRDVDFVFRCDGLVSSEGRRSMKIVSMIMTVLLVSSIVFALYRTGDAFDRLILVVK
jgi:hypothetical protein